MKKLAALLLAFMMIFVVACSSESSSTSSQAEASTGGGEQLQAGGDDYDALLADIIPDQTVELIVYSQLANYSGEQVGWFAEIMLEKFNVKMTIIDEADGTFQTRMTNGDLGDIVLFENNTTEYLQAVEAGMLFDWEDEDLVQTYGPDIWANMQVALEKNRDLSGGTLYGMGHDVATSSDAFSEIIYYPDIRWDLYAELDYPEVTTLEDWVDILADMVALEPTSDTGAKTYAVSLFPDWDGDNVMFAKAVASLYGMEGFGMGFYDTINLEYQEMLKEDGQYIRALRFFNQLFQRGLLKPDSMTQTYDDMREDVLSGAVMWSVFDYMGNKWYNTEEHLAAGKLMMPKAADDQKSLAYGLKIHGGKRVWTIGAKSNYPELCMAIINWLATPEGVLTNEYGPQGVCWDYDANGDTYLTDVGRAAQNDPEVTIEYGNSSGTFFDGRFKGSNTTWTLDDVNPNSASGETYRWRRWKNTIEGEEISEMEQDWRDYTGYTTQDDYLDGEDHVGVTLGTSFTIAGRDTELQTTWTQVTTSIRNNSWNAIYASSDAEFESIIETMISEAHAYGYEECVEWTQEQANIRRQTEKDELGV